MHFDIQAPKFRYAIKREIVLPSVKSTYRIRQISDTHQEADGFRDDLFRAFVAEQAKDKSSVWIHTGDLTDAERPSTRHMKKVMYADRHEAWTMEDKRVFDFLDRHIVPQYQKIAKSCLGIIDGDHCHQFANGMTSGKYISYKLKVPYLGERSGFVNVIFGFDTGHQDKLQYVIHARHGRSGTGTTGGHVNAIERQDSGFMADLHIAGHTHSNHFHGKRVDYVSHHGIIKNRIISYLRPGSLLDGFPPSGRSTYAYRKEYGPLPCGWGEIELTIGRPHNSSHEVLMVKGSVIMG